MYKKFFLLFRRREREIEREEREREREGENNHIKQKNMITRGMRLQSFMQITS